MQIRRVEEENEKIGEFIGDGFTNYANQNGVDLNFDDTEEQMYAAMRIEDLIQIDIG